MKKWFSIIVLLFISFFCLGGTLKQIPSKKLRYVRSWLYQLQNLNLNKVADSRYNMVVMDYSSDGSRRGEYRQSQIRRLKASGKVVLAYLSIGEIENYRFYWRKSWKRTRPSWILFRNQGWAGNYLVRYWKSQWKRILFNRLDSYLYRIMKAGFDGVYLDRVDSYRFWKKRGMSSARQKMIDLVGEISSYVRRGGKGRRYIFVQNAPELAEDNQYLKYVDGIGQESAFFKRNGRPTSATTRRFYRKYLGMFRRAGKLVLTVDYVPSGILRKRAFSLSRALGFIPFAAGKKLDKLEKIQK